MAHMPTYGEDGAACSDSGSCGTARRVPYTATGAEGTDFTVSIGATLAASDYGMTWAPAGVASLPILDLPEDDRTTTQFRVLVGDPLTAGDRLDFFIWE